MTVVYADSLFLINFIVDYLLMVVSARICDVRQPRARLLAAAAVGGFYAVACAATGERFLSSAPMKMAAGVIMSLAAFGGSRRAARVTAVFFAVSAAFAGAVLALTLLRGPGAPLVNVDVKLLAAAFAVCYAVISLVFRGAARGRGRDYAELTVSMPDGNVSMRALIDTGNTLRDPMTGCRVYVTGAGDVAGIFPKSVREKLRRMRAGDAAGLLEELGETDGGGRFRLVPYSAVGVDEGLLLAFRPDEVKLDGVKREGVLIAISPNRVSDSGAYRALIPGDNA
jgi:stage II sporulation protein GA (sporulation sigma-E factor processing peptidase)